MNNDRVVNADIVPSGFEFSDFLDACTGSDENDDEDNETLASFTTPTFPPIYDRDLIHNIWMGFRGEFNKNEK